VAGFTGIRILVHNSKQAKRYDKTRKEVLPFIAEMKRLKDID
jgi:hypothetical protein